MTKTELTIYDHADHTGCDDLTPWGFIGPPHPAAMKLVVPTKRVVCDRCHGEGVHDHPAFSNGVPQEMLDDGDFREAYFSGHHDVRCSQCDGNRVEDVPDWDAMTAAQQKFLNEHQQEMADHHAEVAAEMRMGA